MSTFRLQDITYQEKLKRWEDAVEQVWPEWKEGECTLISQRPEHLEELMLASYSLMKYIREWLTKRRLNFQHGWKFPNLYVALEQAIIITQRGTCNLAHEADKLEQVSRAAYHWIKTMKALGRQPTRAELYNSISEHKSSRRKIYCMCCKKNIATDDSGMLCGYCSGEIKEPIIPIKTDVNNRLTEKICAVCNWRKLTSSEISRGGACTYCIEVNKRHLEGTCSQCRMSCKAGEAYCDLCKIGQREPNKPTTMFVGNERHKDSPIMKGPFDNVNSEFPLDGLAGYGDMLLSTRRNKVS